MPGISQTYLCKSASIAGVSLPGAVSFSVKRTGKPINTRSDGDLYQRKGILTDIEETIEVQARVTGAPPQLGASGSTVVTAEGLTGGLTISGTLTCTATLSVITDVSPSIGSDGEPMVTVTVLVQSDDGVASGIAWT